VSNNVQYIIYGAYDRHNYGDLLFALVLREYLVKLTGVEPLVAATKKSDLESFGALKTMAFSDALKAPLSDSAERRIIVAGGEVLTARWESILAYLAPRQLYYPIKLLPYFLGYPLFARAAEVLTGVAAKMPFVPPRSISPRTKIYYNAVGGSSIDKCSSTIKSYIKNSLMSAEFVSVRDNKTKNNLNELGVVSEVSPDCALLMSDMYPNVRLRTLVSETFLEFLDTQGSYIVFHVSEHHAKGAVEIIADELKKISAKTGLRIALLSIGKAPGHSDDIPLDELSRLIPEISFRVESGHVFEVMQTIASSKLYCGTSLHGAITALAYCVPHIGLLPSKVLKLSSFLEAWSLPEAFGLSEYDRVADNVVECLRRANDGGYEARFFSHVASLKELVSNNFRRLVS
jgi:hypothetical protein